MLQIVVKSYIIEIVKIKERIYVEAGLLIGRCLISYLNSCSKILNIVHLN